MEHIRLKEITVNDPEYKDVWQLREEVLRKPLGLSLKNEDLSRDALDIIIIALHENEVAGCVMLHPLAPGIAKLRAMAVYPAFQRAGIGKLLVEQFEKTARSNNYQTISLHAREVAIGFYKNLGYQVVSDIFTEVGIRHVVMEKLLEP